MTFPFQQALEAAGGPTLPSGGAFTAGSGTIANSANAVTIHQATNRGVIDWKNFSIGAGGSVLFQNGSGATLNRVTGSQMSLILGSLQATGTVYLINPQGVIIGPNGRVKTGGDFVASTLNLPNSLFLSGGALVFDGKSKAFVKNLGAISSTGGNIFLIAGNVANKGTISASNGSVGMAAGERVLLADSGSDQRIFVSAGTGDVTNKGTITAAQAELKANDGNIYALAGNTGGEIRATGTANRDGHVWLVSNNGTTQVTGKIAAQNADGNGGSIETSGHTVEIGNTSIKTGAGGSWLVDPVDLTIDSSAASTIQTALTNGTNVTESTDASSSSGYGTTASGNGDINVASSISWSSAASLTLSAYRNINVQDGVTIASAGSGDLTLHADNAATGTGTVNFSGTATGKINFTGSGNVDLFYHPVGYPTATNYSSNVTMGTGKFTPYMTVDTALDLQNINTNLGGTYALNTDIDTSTFGTFNPIAHGAGPTTSSDGFSGIFDGQGHTVDNLTVNDSTDLTAGLFSQTSSSGIIRNVGLKNASVTSRVNGAAVGGLVGENWGNITASYVSGSVAGNGGGNTAVGGLVGENDGTITNTYSSASVSATTGNVWVGGLVGENGVQNYVTGTISYSLATGPVTTNGTASAYIGGLVGENDTNINGSYFDNQRTGQTGGDGFCNVCISDDITGQTTATLQNGSLPSGFSSSIWRASLGSYPKFTWERIPVSGIVYNGPSPLPSVTVVGLANGTSFGSTTTDGSGAYTLTAPAGTTSVLTYLTGVNKGNTFSDSGTTSFTGVDIYTNTLRLINATNNNYSAMITALSTALGSNSGSNFLFSISSGNLTLGSGANFAVISSVATNIDQSIAGTGTVMVQSSGDLTINASKTISATGAGTPLTLVAGGKFMNNGGVNALSTSGGGRWLVYSQNPANDTVGSLSYGFKQYSATYGSTTVAQSTGNGLLYTTAPTLTPSLTGSISKTYDATTTATITAANLTSAGALTGDTIALSAAGATYADKNQGSSKSVTATGVSATATDSTGATVYGYQLSSTSASGNIGTINPALLTYTANTASRTYGAANPTFSGTVTGFVGGDTQATATTGTLSFGTPATTASNVGNYAINGTGLTANNGNYTFQQAAANATALTINPALLSYTANTASRTYGGINPAFSGSVTGFVNGDTQATATTGTLAFTSLAASASNAGSYAINGSGLSATNYTLQQAAGNATAFTINPAQLTYTYTANAASRTYGAANPALSGTVTGFVNGNTQATATTGTLSFTTTATTASNVGSYAVNGSGLTANNGNYTFQQAAANATALTINPALLSYTANTASRTYGDANPAFSGSVIGFVNGDTQATATTGTLSFTNLTTSASNVGSYAINGSGLTANSNYTLQQAAGNATALTINPAQLTYTADTASRSYGAANPAFTGAVSGFVNGETLASATTGTLSFTTPATSASNAGNYAVNGSGLAANNGNYTFQQAAGNATALTVNPAQLLYTADPVSRTYGGTNPAFTGTVTGFANGDTQATATTGTLSFTSSATSTSNVGSYAINGLGLTANSNYSLAQAAGNATALTINPALLTYTANAASRTYGAANPSFSGSVTGFVNGETQASATTGTLSFTSPATASSNVGNYAINGGGLTANNGNYTLQQAAGNSTALTINPALLTYTADSASRSYGSANPAFTGSVTGFVNSDTLASATTGTLSFTTPAISTSNVGNYAVNGSGLSANNGNYTFQQAAGNTTALTINPAQLLYTANPVSRTYGGANPALSGTVTGFVNGDSQASATTGTLSFTTSATSASNAGSYAINGSGLTANGGNYTLAQAAGNATALTIDPALLTYTANTASRTYGGANPAFSGSVTGFVNGDTQATATTGTLAFTSPATSASNAGSYAIDGSGLTANSNYTLQQAAGNSTALTINPALLTYTANAASRTYGASNPLFSGSVIGFVNGETLASATTGTLSFTSPATSASNAGNYAVNGSGLAANNGNYTFQQAAGNSTALTINPAQLLYTANAVSRIYGDTNPALSGTVTGFVNGDTQASATTGTLGFSTAATNTTGVGNYAIDGSGLTANSNYTLAQASGNAAALTINPAQLTASVLANDKVYDATTSATGRVANLSGVLNGDEVTVNNSSATFRFNDKNVGNGKTVTETGAALSGGGASNYTLTVTPGTANITPAPVAAAVSAKDKLYDATPEASGHIGALAGVLGNDDVQADSSHAVYAFSDKNAGTNKSVAASGVTLTGADAGNYTLALANGSAAITPATVTASVIANNKTYDGTLPTTGSLGSLTGVLGRDSVTLNSAKAVYSFFNPNSGTGKAVTATGATLAGADAANYRLSIQNGLANINPVPVTVSVAGANRLVGAPNPAFAAVYNGGPLPGVSIPGLLSSISFSVNATSASGPGTYAITGASSYPNVDLTVLPGTLTINFAATPKTDPSMAAAKRIDPPPLSAPALSNSILPPSSLGLLQVSYSTNWSSLGNSAASVSPPMASASFLTSGTSSDTYQGGIRPW